MIQFNKCKTKINWFAVQPPTRHVWKYTRQQWIPWVPWQHVWTLRFFLGAKFAYFQNHRVPPLKTNISHIPLKWWLEDANFPFKMAAFSGDIRQFFGGGSHWKLDMVDDQAMGIFADRSLPEGLRTQDFCWRDGWVTERFPTFGWRSGFFILEGVLWCRNTFWPTNRLWEKNTSKRPFSCFFWLEGYCDLVWMFCGREFVKAKIHSAVALFIRNLFLALGMNFLLYTCKK